MHKLSWEQVNLWRLENQHLLKAAADKDMLKVVQEICAAQAQVMSAAELTFSARTTSLKSSDVQTALWQERSLVKSWFMRGTLHLLSSADYPLYISAFGTMKHYLKGSWYRYFDVTPDELTALLEAIKAVLGAAGMSREALSDAVGAKTNSPKLREKLLSGWGALLKPASFQGLLCFADSEGQNVRFVQPKQWLGEWEAIEPSKAIPEIARRFLRAYGPAKAIEFARYLGIPDADAKKVFKALGDEIVAVEVEDWKAMALPEMFDVASESYGRVNLLGHFDPYTIMVAPHSNYLLAGDKRGRVYRPQGWIMPVVLFDGRIVGIWEQDTKGKKTSIKIELFEEKGEVLKQGIEKEAERLGQFLESNFEIVYS